METIWKGAAEGNYRVGRSGHAITAIVIHVTDAAELSGTDAWFNTPSAKLSAHYGVAKTGEIHQYVKEEDEAFHAGTVDDPSWPVICPGGACEDVNLNLFTMGIEHGGLATHKWPDEQYTASSALIADICQRCEIPCDDQHVIPHHAIRAGKTYPGKGDVGCLISMAKRIISQKQVHGQHT